ncbi:MAG: GMC family oxidoreductase [Deltaproteobacteria bacterium]|nr:GMC family oxidoreductase [Deltaproteobacteria bacterium]
MKVHDGRAHAGDLELSCDLVIIGSGAGGAVVAAEAAEAGQDVIVLEEGGHVPASEYAGYSTLESMQALFRGGGTTFALGVGRSPFINVTMGRCVGGSSVITGGVCFRTPEHITDTWVKERRLKGLSSRALEPYFEEVEKAIHVETVPEEMRSGSTLLFGKGAAARGHPLEPIRRNTEGCHGCGRCNFGCPHQAKRSVDLNYLPRAVAAGARIHSGCLVEKITHAKGRATGVVGRLLGGRGDAPRGRLRVKARRVVLAAGSYHGPLVLQKSGLVGPSGQVGRNMTLHPGFRVMARFDEPVRGWAGSLQAAYSDAFEHERFTMIGLFLPPGVLAATLPGVGPGHLHHARHIPNLAVFGGIIHDEGGGRVRRGLGREPFVTYRMAPEDLAVVPKILREMGEIYLAAGAKELFLPILGLGGVSPERFRSLDLEKVKPRDLECSSQHPLGTCRMGESEKSSVVDEQGKLWGLEDLYVADGSIVPSSLGVNPQLTIMAMALKVARGMLEVPLS